MREDLDLNKTDALEQRIEAAFLSREAWLKQRQSGAIIDQGLRPVELPSARESFRNLFGFNFKPKDPKKK
jgi:hypothetical protein